MNAWTKMVRRWRGASFGALLFAAGCSTAEITTASTDAASQACNAGPITYCDAMPPGPNGCVGDPTSTNTSLRQLPTDKSFAVGCTANFLDPESAANGDCTPIASCTCTAAVGDVGNVGDGGDGGKSPSWSCSP